MKEVIYKPPFKVEGTKIIDSNGIVVTVCFTQEQAQHQLREIKKGIELENQFRNFK